MNLLKKLWKEEMQINAYSLYSRDLEESIKQMEKEMNVKPYIMVEWRLEKEIHKPEYMMVKK